MANDDLQRILNAIERIDGKLDDHVQRVTALEGRGRLIDERCSTLSTGIAENKERLNNHAGRVRDLEMSRAKLIGAAAVLGGASGGLVTVLFGLLGG